MRQVRIEWEVPIVERYTLDIDTSQLAGHCGVAEEDVLGWIASGTLLANVTEHLQNSDLFGDNENSATSGVDDIGIREVTNVEVPG